MDLQTITKGALCYLTAPHIQAPHCFTTRQGGVSGGYLSSLNLGSHRGDTPENVETNYSILADAIGFSPEKLVLTHQVHSDIVRQVSYRDANGLDHTNYPPCDALITNVPGTALMVFSADCTPILFYDPITGAVGAAHAGWRGTASRIAEKTVNAMISNFGCEAKNIRAAIGPNIGVCCFETHEDVPSAMLEAFGDDISLYIHPAGEKYYVNLKEINAYQIRQAGVTQIDISTACTVCRNDLFWSHRIAGAERGSQGAIIVCKEARE